VSGELPLARRPGLLRAIEMVEAGEADHIVVAYFDRLVDLRDRSRQADQRYGGDADEQQHDGRGVSVLRRGDRREGRGCPGARGGAGCAAQFADSPGYVRGGDGVLVVERPKARGVVQAFRRRDRGASLVELQAWLAENGIERSISGVASMLRSRMYLGEIHFGDLHNTRAHEPMIKDRALFERVQRRTVSRGRQAKSERLLARLGVLRRGSCGSRMVINSYTGSCRCGDSSANRCQRRAAVKADRVEELVLDAVRAHSVTADVHGRLSRRQQIREADEAIDRANADLDETIRQLGELGLLGRPASRETLGKLTKALDDAHAVRARLGDVGESKVIGPDDIEKLREPKERLAAWRRLITDTVESVTVAPALTAGGRHSRRWDPRRIDIRFIGQHP
jgi:hypothetical protein